MINESLKAIIGDELFNQVKAKVDAAPNKDKILIENVDLESGNYIPKAKFNSVNESLKERDGQVATMNQQLEDLKKANKGNEDFVTQIKDLQTANATIETTYKTKISEIEKSHAIDEALHGAKAKNVNALKGVLDLSKVEYKDGKITGLDDQIVEVKKTASYLFDAPKSTPGFNPPAGGGEEPTPSQVMNQLIRGNV